MANEKEQPKKDPTPPKVNAPKLDPKTKSGQKSGRAGPKRPDHLDGGGDQVPGTGERGKNPWN